MASNYEDLTGKVFGDLTVIKQGESNFSKRDNGNIREIRKWECKCICGNNYNAFESKLKNGKTKNCGCKKYRDKIGMKFGKLEIIGYEKDNNGNVLYLCRCECGNEGLYKYSSLNSGKTKSCGCLRMTDLTGKKIGKLTVIEKCGKNKNGETLFKCLCDCGNEYTTTYTKLNNELVKSCGCLVAETLINNSKKYNTYEYKDDYIIIHDNIGNNILIDKDDFNLVKDKYISLNGGGYPYYTENKKSILLHTVIYPTDEGYCVDHINRNRNDDRRCNLRIVTEQENLYNKGLYKNNNSGVSGVFWRKRDKCWYSTIQKDGKKIHLGQYKDKYEAIKARLIAEKELFGDLAPQKHLFEEYNIN